MPRARGGRRVGARGAQYPNRRDLQLAPRAAPGQTYGEAGAQLAAQRALPIAAPPTQNVGPPPGGAPASSSFVAPGSLGALDRESDRSSLPVTAGAALGPGPGLEALGLAASGSPGPVPLDLLRDLYRQHPNEDLREIIEDAEEGIF